MNSEPKGLTKPLNAYNRVTVRDLSVVISGGVAIYDGDSLATPNLHRRTREGVTICTTRVAQEWEKRHTSQLRPTELQLVVRKRQCVTEREGRMFVVWYRLRKMGPLDVRRVVSDHQVWRLVTSNWLHARVFHLWSNTLALLVVGINLEQEFGFIRIGLLYIVSGFGGSILSALFIKSGILVGSSGALFGFLRGMLSEYISNWTLYSKKLMQISALVTLVVIFVITLVLGTLPHVDTFAHIGGFLSSFFTGFVLLIRPQFN